MRRADADHDIGVGPQVVPDGQRGEQRVGGRDHAVPHPARRHRRLQQRRQGGDRVAGVLGAAADDDQRTLGASEERRGAFDGRGVDGRPAGDGIDEHRFGGRRPSVGCHLDGDRARASRHDRVDRRLDLGGGQRRIDDELDLLGELRQDRRLVGEFVQHAPSATLGARLDLADDGEHTALLQ